jgi:hypothetical protein
LNKAQKQLVTFNSLIIIIQMVIATWITANAIKNDFYDFNCARNCVLFNEYNFKINKNVKKKPKNISIYYFYK